MSLFISLEGGEGAGKTTQINRLADFLTAQGHRVLTTREPGGTKEAESIRNLLVQRDGGDWDAMAEVLLLYAARVMHINKVIKPALADGKIVICDRFSDSTMAYQGYGRGLDKDKITEIERITIDGFKPDLTLILDLGVRDGLARSNKRLSGQKGYEQTEDRFERMDLEFHENLRAGFLDIAKQEPMRCSVINAAQSVDLMASDIQNIVAQKLKA
ncbi:MAG: dTMP kinase [Alphaproteobacteria bacterium]